MDNLDKIIQPEDYKYRVETPDPNFSPQRNKAIIKETIEETDKFFALLQKAAVDGMGERLDMLSAYGVYRFNKGSMTFKDYMGKEAMKTIIGEKILEKIRILEANNKLTGRKDRFIQL